MQFKFGKSIRMNSSTAKQHTHTHKYIKVDMQLYINIDIYRDIYQSPLFPLL